MNKNEKDALKDLSESFDGFTKSVTVPEALEPENIVFMLKHSDSATAIHEKKAEKSNIIILKRLTALAASVAVFLIVALLSKYPQTIRVVESNGVFEGFNALNPIQHINGYADVEKAAQNILENGQVTATQVSNETSDTESRLDRIRQALYEKYGHKDLSNTETTNDFSAVPSVSSIDVSSSENQCADIVKSNDKNLFILKCIYDKETNTNVEQIEIVNCSPSSDIKIESIINISESSSDTSNECMELYLKNNVLIAMVRSNPSLGSSYTTALYYDISDSTNPKLICKHVQDGSYEYSSLSDNKLCIATSKTISQAEHSVPTYSVNGKKYEVGEKDVLVSVNAPESSYLLVTATDITDLSKEPASLLILGCGKDITVSGNSMYLTRSFASSDNGSRKTEIYHFKIDESSMIFAGSCVFDGTIIGGAGISKSQNIGIITSSNNCISAYILDSSLNIIGSAPSFTNAQSAVVNHTRDFALVSTGQKTSIVDFSSGNTPIIVGSLNDIDESTCFVSISDNKVLSLTKSSDELCLRLIEIKDSPIITAKYSLSPDLYSPAWGDERSAIISDNILGIPIISQNEDGTSSSAYVLFDTTDGIKPIGTFQHNDNYISDAATRGTIVNNTLYTISGEKIVSFALEDKSIISTLEVS